MLRLLLSLFVLLCSAGSSVFAGYEMPSYVDGCRSMTGRFEIGAKQTVTGKSSHGPHKWIFIWKDLEKGETREFAAKGIQGGQTRCQLFIAPDGETFALWNHITMWWEGKSHMHAHSHKEVLKRDHEDPEAFRSQFIFQNRLIIYRKDGSIIRSLAIQDVLETDEEWRHVLPVFTRAEWLRPYNNLYFKNMARTSYAFTKVSPDYTMLEFQVGNPKSPRAVRVSLVDGTLQPSRKRLPVEQTPVLMIDAKEVPKSSGEWKESYTPSLDPVRVAGRYRIDSIEQAFPLDKAPKKRDEFKVGDVRLIADGFRKADTPSWLKKRGKSADEAGRLLFTDLEAQTMYTLFPDDRTSVVRFGATRGRIAGDGRTFYGLIDQKLCAWEPYGKREPTVLLAENERGLPLSLNDMVISNRGLIYFTTLKDPEKGRLSVYDPKSGKLTVLFDGVDKPTLANPNGVALSRNERFLYVGISNYKARQHSGVYAFPINAYGTIVLGDSTPKPRFAVKAPDGIVVDRQDNVYFTSGNVVHVFNRYAQPIAKIKIPKGSGTNLGFGGSDRFRSTLFITTWNAVYAVQTPVGL